MNDVKAIKQNVILKVCSIYHCVFFHSHGRHCSSVRHYFLLISCSTSESFLTQCSRKFPSNFRGWYCLCDLCSTLVPCACSWGAVVMIDKKLFVLSYSSAVLLLSTCCLILSLSHAYKCFLWLFVFPNFKIKRSRNQSNNLPNKT